GEFLDALKAVPAFLALILVKRHVSILGTLRGSVNFRALRQRATLASHDARAHAGGWGSVRCGNAHREPGRHYPARAANPEGSGPDRLRRYPANAQAARSSRNFDAHHQLSRTQ